VTTKKAGRPRLYPADSVMLSVRLSGEQVRHLDLISPTSRQQALQAVVAAGMLAVRPTTAHSTGTACNEG
jgi:hypothetical protein